MKRLILTLLLSTMFQSTVYADDHDDLVDEYIVISGFDAVFASVPGLIQSSIDRSLSRSSNPGLERKYYGSLKQSFDPEVMQQAARAYLLEHADSDYLEAMIEWYESPLGNKMKQAGFDTNKPENKPALAAYMKEVQANKPRRSRIDMIIRMEEVTNSAGILTELSTTIMRAVLDAKSAMVDDSQPLETEVQKIEKLRPALHENLRRQLVLVSFYTYRDFDDKELFEVIKFYRTPVGMREIVLTEKVLVKVMGDWFSAALKEVSEQIRKDKAANSSPRHST